MNIPRRIERRLARAYMHSIAPYRSCGLRRGCLRCFVRDYTGIHYIAAVRYLKRMRNRANSTPLSEWRASDEVLLRVLARGMTLHGQASCDTPEGHDYYVALDQPCDHCGAAV